MKTIIQKLPTIYGEALNGSVYGQPNGSIARPPQSVGCTVVLVVDSGKLTLDDVDATGAFYILSGVTPVISVPELATYKQWIVYNAANEVVAMGVYPYILQGDPAKVPDDGDSLTIVMALRNDSGTFATSDPATITAEVPS